MHRCISLSHTITTRHAPATVLPLAVHLACEASRVWVSGTFLRAGHGLGPAVAGAGDLPNRGAHAPLNGPKGSLNESHIPLLLLSFSQRGRRTGSPPFCSRGLQSWALGARPWGRSTDEKAMVSVPRLPKLWGGGETERSKQQSRKTNSHWRS